MRPRDVLGMIEQLVVGDGELPSSFLDAYFWVVDIFLETMETCGVSDKLFPAICLDSLFHKHVLAFESEGLFFNFGLNLICRNQVLTQFNELLHRGGLQSHMDNIFALTVGGVFILRILLIYRASFHVLLENVGIWVGAHESIRWHIMKLLDRRQGSERLQSRRASRISLINVDQFVFFCLFLSLSSDVEVFNLEFI